MPPPRPAQPAAWLRHYRPEWFRPDLVAGLTAAAVVLPNAMAYATVAGLPVEVGLYTCLVPMLAYALLGSSRSLSVSTTTTLAILVGAELKHAVPGGGPAELLAASASLTLLVGLILLLAALLRFGFVASFISQPVLVGFKSGIGLVIVLDQVPKLLGFTVERQGFFRDLIAVLGRLGQTSPATLVLSLVLFALLAGLSRWRPQLPAALLAVALAIAATSLFGLERFGVAVVGPVPTGLPPPQLPALGLELIHRQWPAAAGIALMSFTESIAAARSFAAADEPRPLANRELLALGLANGLGACFGAMAGGGGTHQTAVNRLAGARTQLAELVTAGSVVLTLLLLGPLIARMPQAALAVVVVFYSLELIAPRQFLAIRRVRREEFLWALTALAGVMVLGTLRGILVAVVVSLLALASQEMHPPVYALARLPGTDVFRPRSPRHPGDQTWPGLLLLRLEGRLFFANAEAAGAAMLALIEQDPPQVVVLDFSAVIDIEYTALAMLIQAERRLAGLGISLWLAALNPGVLRVVRHSELGRRLGDGRLLFNLEQAVERYERLTASAPAGRLGP